MDRSPLATCSLSFKHCTLRKTSARGISLTLERKKANKIHYSSLRKMVAANGTSFMSIPLITLQTYAAFGSLIPYRLSPNPKFRNVALGSFIEGDSHPTTVPPRPEVHECIWGDTFLSSYPPEDFKPSAAVEERINELKKQVVSMLHIGSSQTCLKKINSLINNIQRLGLAYHFESELENLLKIINDDTNHHYYDLHDVALRFRLLRQDGYYVSSDVFDQFKSSEGGFDPNLCADVKGLLSLYEAACLGIHGEDILTEAIAFTMKYLKLLLTQQPRPSSRKSCTVCFRITNQNAHPTNRFHDVHLYV